MKLELGIPDVGTGASLPRRLAWVTGARLVILSIPLLVYFRTGFQFGRFTAQVTIWTLVTSFALTAVYAAWLRSGKRLQGLAEFQVIVDQVLWTLVVYVTGGVASGATSFYGLTCVAGAMLTGSRGAARAALAAGVSYLTLAALLYLGVLPPPPDQPPDLYRFDLDELVYYALINLLVLVVVALLAGYLAERLRWTGGELVEARERALSAERMAALGRLAAGLAHEIRNPLSSIGGSVQLLRSGTGLSEEDRQLCDIVQREVARLNDLVTDMLDLSRPRQPEPVVVDLSSVARDVVALTTKFGRAASDVMVNYSGADKILVRADRSQLRQLIWNLVRNAVQASSAGDTVVVYVERAPDGTVSMEVRDRGVGLDQKSKERIFDAFFTTRTKGTGVGLAVVKRIVDEHGFRIDVQSEEGKGATFVVDFGKEPAAVSSETALDPEERA